MNFQDELSQNARLSGKIAEEATSKTDQMARTEAERSALGITASIKAMLLENVRQGTYAKQYNKGTAECYFAIPNNRYLKLNPASSYNRKHVCTSLSYRFSVKPEHTAEFEYLQTLLNNWGKENQVKISWVVRVLEYAGEYPFPSQEYHPFPPHRIGLRFQLSVKAVTHFPVDPDLPIDHMSADDIADQERKTQARIEQKRKICASKKNDFIKFSALAVLFAVFTVVCFIAESYGWMLLELLISIVFGSAAHSSYDDYRMIKNRLENGAKSEE